jgi:energy-coupling factor transporter ATP-binding protein EcfA2
MSRQPELRNPFVGLRPFESEDSLYYFGRREQIKALLQELHQNRFLAVVGSSGCGKSSLVRAGLIPNLEAGFLVQDRDRWFIAAMKPGNAPLQNLARALLNVLGESTEAEALEAYSEALRRKGAPAVLAKTIPVLDAHDANLLLLVDQFEELFRFQHESGSGKDEAADFVSILLRLAEQAEAPIFICMTMRSDFLGECDAFQGLPEAMNRSQYLVPRLTHQQRREAIAGPICLSGAAIAPRLLDRLLNENMDTRDDLPILQHALMRTWAEWARDGHGPLDMEHYDRIHTIKRALNDHADEALNELNEGDQGDRIIAKRLFQALTETDVGNRRVRRPAKLSEIAATSGATPQKALEVIRKFREDDRNFLLLSSEDPEDDPLVDISHESFIRQWQTLSGWVDEEAESAKIYRRLAETAELYDAHRADLYHEADLQVALEWREKERPTPAWGSRYHRGFETAMKFLDESRTVRDQEAIEKEKERAEKERLLQEKNQLLEQQTIQQEKSLGQQKINLRQARIFMAVLAAVLLFAIAAGIFAGYHWQQAKLSAEAAKKNATEANYNLAKVFEEKALKALKEARENNAAGDYKQVWLYTAAALKQEVGPDRMAMSIESASALLGPENIIAAFAERWFSPSVNYHKASIRSVTFSPDGKTLASGSDDGDNTIRLWDVETGTSRRELKGHSRAVSSVAFSPDGKTLASGSGDNTIRLWDVETGTSRRELKGYSSWVNSVAFSPDGKTLASGSVDNTIRLWDVETGTSRRELKGHSSYVLSVAFSPEGKTLASGSEDNTIRLWDVPFYFLFWKDNKPTELLNVFSAGAEFFWQIRREDLEFKPHVNYTLYPQNGYHFKFDPKFQPLLKPPAPGQSKFDQILEWAKIQVEQSK